MSLWSALKEEVALMRNLVRNRIYISPKTEAEVVRAFHKLFYDSHKYGKTFVDTYWLGCPILKCPFDMWIYQEMIYQLKPDLIIECGTAEGGSAFFYASMFDLVGHGEIVTIDIVKKDNRPQHKRIAYLHGSSISPEMIEQVRHRARGKERVLVILDSDHSKDHVLAELRLYHPIVTTGSYLVVEDSNVNGHPVYPAHGPGPTEALKEFLKENHDFEIDKTKEKFYVTFNPNGYLKKIR